MTFEDWCMKYLEDGHSAGQSELEFVESAWDQQQKRIDKLEEKYCKLATSYDELFYKNQELILGM